MQKISQLIYLTLFFALLAAYGMAQIGLDDGAQKSNTESVNSAYYCTNTTIYYNGCDYSSDTGESDCNYNGNLTFTDCCTGCYPSNPTEAAALRRRFLQRHINVCRK